MLLASDAHQRLRRTLVPTLRFRMQGAGSAQLAA